MQRLLGPEYEAFLASYDQPRTHGLRTNTLKIAPEELAARLGMELEPVPWAPGGFYYHESDRPGRHPYHAAGLFYIQEPSAMSAAAMLAPRPGDRVLDLCAAPGGKATHLAALMQNQGLLVANEVQPSRAYVLAQQIERLGVSCAAVTTEHPRRLAERFPAFFDRILVDAPCSGEGMFRKEPEAVKEWGIYSPAGCAARQSEILDLAVQMLRPGGYLLYSTCTFAPEEDEQVILGLIRRFPEMEVAEPAAIPGAVPGNPAWAAGEAAGCLEPHEEAQILRTRRLWPHRVRGEGHFLALLHKRAGGAQAARDAAGALAAAERTRPDQQRGPSGRRPREGRRTGDPLEKALPLLHEFSDRYLTVGFSGTFALWGEALYQLPEGLPDLAGLKVVRPGLHLGDVKRDRFEPSHALAMALPPQVFRQRRELSPDEVERYLRGETLPAAGEEGWTLVTYDGFSLGWAKAAGGLLKNHFPRSLRIQ
jgi:NOL1/NOP2/sun family putative RNA methylase